MLKINTSTMHRTRFKCLCRNILILFQTHKMFFNCDARDETRSRRRVFVTEKVRRSFRWSSSSRCFLLGDINRVKLNLKKILPTKCLHSMKPWSMMVPMVSENWNQSENIFFAPRKLSTRWPTFKIKYLLFTFHMDY